VWTGKFQGIPQSQFGEWLDKAGTIPLPPYIHREAVGSDRQRYQTVYAENTGSLAAPTAGFHFTKRLLDELESAGSVLRHLALNIGLGTFEPLRSADFTDFKIHSESFYIPTETAAAINSCTEDDSPVTLVGTTVLRTLESAVDGKRKLTAGGGIAGIFISPPYEFKVSNRLLTNFHRPDSTIIQLVAALIGWDSLNLCYHTALAEDFGFYSYGDAMLVI
jgi:S-adenosylmethionine:tRNA ribosyltransferase-isomerase